MIRGFFFFLATCDMLSPIKNLDDLKRKLDTTFVNAFVPPKSLTDYINMLLLKKYDIGGDFAMKTVRTTATKDRWEVILKVLTQWEIFGFLVPEESKSCERLTRNSAPFATPPPPHIQEKNVDLTEDEVRLISDIRGQGIDDNAIIKVSDLQSLTQFTHLL